ncbi:MAG: UDPGP type 1 family protein [Planctomycetaceae bacterium]|jgi:UDP-N-acetylglucosamine/UDP-N-acetylgalactosamine diphosphorylase|nr:UDPGP type 1 family protein [Planctomycetaceae bacterium]
MFDTMKTQLLEKLAPFRQEHLLTFWDSLTAAEQQHLAAQIEQIDFAQLAQLYADRDKPAESLTLADRAAEPPFEQFSTVRRSTSGAGNAYAAGEELLRQGKAAAVLVAGGQGTRLGFDHPKGMYPIGPVSGKTLFQIHFEKVLAAVRRYGHRIPYCVMTSPATHAETVEFLTGNKFFGLKEDDVLILCQGTMPAVSMDSGKVLLADKGGLALSPDGHGGMLKALSFSRTACGRQTALETLKSRGIEYLFYNQVDNPLVRILSPEMLGYHVLSGSELTSQVIRKTNPLDKVGNVVKVGDKLYVIEYSDLPNDVAERRKSDGSLQIWAGSIAVHIFNVELLERCSKIASSLPFHTARKKVSYTDLQTGETVKPSEPNAVKFERFIFDLLPSAKNAIVVEVDPPNHYAPLKNAPGSPEFSPETVSADISAMHTSWLEQSGVKAADGVNVEISPLFADSPEALAGKIAAGAAVEKDTYFE